jgi:hypothetical protein
MVTIVWYQPPGSLSRRELWVDAILLVERCESVEKGGMGRIEEANLNKKKG